jgi:hypothetical protein
MSDMAQLLGAKDLHSFVSYLLRIFDYAYDTKVGIWFANCLQYVLVH